MISVNSSRWLCLAIFLFMTVPLRVSPAYCEEPEDDTINLTLEDGKLMVLKNNLDIAVQQISPQISSGRLYTEKGAFDPVLSGSFSRQDSNTPLSTRSSVAAGGRSSVKSESYSLSTDLSGKLAAGTEYSFEFQNSWTENSFNSFNTEYDAFTGISITQPLLKNFGSGANEFNIVIARKNHDLSISDLKQNAMNTLASYKNAYWDLVLALEDLKVKQEALKLARSLLDLNRKRLKAGVTSPLDVTQAEAGVASREEDLIVAENVVRTRENALKSLITSDLYSIRNVRVIPVDKPVVNPAVLDTESNFKQGINNRPDYAKALTEINKQDITVQYEKNQKYPNIDLEASYGYNGIGNSFGESLTNMDNNDEWSLGVVIKIPLGNREAKGRLTVAQLEAKQGLLNLKKIEQEILVQIDNAISSANTNMQRIDAAKVSVRLAEDSLNAEEIKLKQGLSTSHDVLQFQEELFRARSREITAVIDYIKSLVELSRVRGTMLQEEGVMISNDSIDLARR